VSAAEPDKRLSAFERYLSVWVALCIVAGIAIGRLSPGLVAALSRLEVSHVSLPIAVLVWLMIYPMMLRIDFAALRGVGQRPAGVLVVLFVNWLVKPFSMALLGWLFFKHLFAGMLGPELGDQYLAGVIILAAAPCTAMVFVWSYLTDGDPAYTLVQVALNDLIMLVAFAPIVVLLLGVSDIAVPYDVLLYSVLLYIVVPLGAGVLSRGALLRAKGRAWFEDVLLLRLKPVAVGALLATLVLIFAFQGEVILGRLSHIALIAIPLLIQVYFNAGLAYGMGRWLGVPHSVAAPGALIGASNFFELAVATAISLFGLTSGATLATVVGVLVEVPVMLSVCRFCNRTRHWFASPDRAPTGPRPAERMAGAGGGHAPGEARMPRETLRPRP
jgi:ACR3 family arsenite transporter